MARLIKADADTVQKDRIGCAREFALSHEVYVVLKGARTVIAMPDGRVHVNPTGNPGMASGGMGDVLTGMIAGFIAQQYSIKSALRVAVYLHGAAADVLQQTRAPYGFLATDVANILPDTIKSVMDGTFVNLSSAYTPIL